MRILEKVALGIVLASMLFAFGCCCTGGLDDEDLVQNTHNQGAGGAY